MVRLGKIYKLLRLMRLVKVFKILKNKENLAAHFEEKLKISAGTERLVLCGFGFVFFTHIFACIWIIAGQLENDNPESWMYDSTMDKSNLYLTSFYFTITSITTVVG